MDFSDEGAMSPCRTFPCAQPRAWDHNLLVVGQTGNSPLIDSHQCGSNVDFAPFAPLHHGACETVQGWYAVFKSRVLNIENSFLLPALIDKQASLLRPIFLHPL